LKNKLKSLYVSIMKIMHNEKKLIKIHKKIFIINNLKIFIINNLKIFKKQNFN